jgi:CRISPR-associated protein Cmr6
MPTHNGRQATPSRRNDVANTSFDTTSQGTHCGLWLDKYLSVQGDDNSTAVANLFNQVKDAKVPEGYRDAFERRKSVLSEFPGGCEEGETRFYQASTQGRLIVGLGVQSVRETNIALLHTWGVPYIPGSALKGLAAATASQMSTDPAWKSETKTRKQGDQHATLFGNTSSSGYVIFHDAWWVPDSQEKIPLDRDIMTVHHQEYYSGKEEPPADWDNPTPVAFLTTKGKFLVALSGPRPWVDAAAKWLLLGLELLGVGAKTAVGYGRMTWEPELSAADKAVQTLDTKLDQIRASYNGAATIGGVVDCWRRLIDPAQWENGHDESWMAQVRSQVQESARDFIRTNDSSTWKKWAGKDNRKPEEKAFFEQYKLLEPKPQTHPAKVVSKSESSVGESKPSSQTAETTIIWAWMAWDKRNRIYMYGTLENGEKVKDIRSDLVKLSEKLKQRLMEANEQSPVKVRVVLRSGNKIPSQSKIEEV